MTVRFYNIFAKFIQSTEKKNPQRMFFIRIQSLRKNAQNIIVFVFLEKNSRKIYPEIFENLL